MITSLPVIPDLESYGFTVSPGETEMVGGNLRQLAKGSVTSFGRLRSRPGEGSTIALAVHSLDPTGNDGRGNFYRVRY